jgi:tripartite-type tricarboxylate transporter receptor subunit TctC
MGRIATGLALCLAATGAFESPARADAYPDRTVRIIVPFPPGGTADLLPRAVADWLSRKWGQPVVIENRTGAAGNIGAEQAYRSAPDGYTLLSSPPPPLVINQNLYRNLAFDPLKFEPIIVMAMVPNALFAALKLITRLAEQPLPYATLCPQYETIVDRRVRAIPRRTVAPAAAALQHMQDAADNPPIICPILASHVRR